MLGIVSLLAIGGSLWMRHVSYDSQCQPPEVGVVSVLGSDSISHSEDEVAGKKKFSGHHKKKAGSGKSRKKRSGNKKKGSLQKSVSRSAGNVGQPQWRDLLTDTIPVSLNGNQ